MVRIWCGRVHVGVYSMSTGLWAAHTGVRPRPKAGGVLSVWWMRCSFSVFLAAVPPPCLQSTTSCSFFDHPGCIRCKTCIILMSERSTGRGGWSSHFCAGTLVLYLLRRRQHLFNARGGGGGGEGREGREYPLYSQNVRGEAIVQ